MGKHGIVVHCWFNSTYQEAMLDIHKDLKYQPTEIQNLKPESLRPLFGHYKLCWSWISNFYGKRDNKINKHL